MIQQDVKYGAGSNQNIGRSCIKNARKKQMTWFDKSNCMMTCILYFFLNKNFVMSDDTCNEQVVRKGAISRPNFYMRLNLKLHFANFLAKNLTGFAKIILKVSKCFAFRLQIYKTLVWSCNRPFVGTFTRYSISLHEVFHRAGIHCTWLDTHSYIAVKHCTV